ncbi:hypothetical protein BK735P2_00015 [Bacteroides phage BK735P2]|nr:hypothetical protein BK735P2_00015 [Bacteroides phage BK735P2]
MNVQIPIAGLTLVDNQTYDGQLPVWATRPLMIRIKPDFISGNEYPVYIRVSNGGAIKKEIVFPYQEELDVDLSFAAPLLNRADRNKSEGDPAFPQQAVEIWSSNPANKITLPVFHCDETYWDTLGVDSALPQPPKPRIPNQTLDIYFPYRIHPLDAFPVEVEPVTGAPSNVIFPTSYVLGNTIDIKYIKKLTIKNVWGSGLDQVINYEDRLMSDVVYDESMQCALRARWNMRNGQWFWAAFKDYFWSNKFTPIRGRGGVTEQAEITINLEYGEEWYNVYQELLVSSNVVFELNIPGINQYQSKRFRAEVVGDTGARWSNSTKTYRQQVRFRTTELQDNYVFPLAPDQPPTPSIAFSAQRNPWTVGAAHAEGLVNSIYSNAAWEVQSTPAWMSVGNMATLTANDFEQGGLAGAVGTSYEDMKFASNSYIRSKNPVPVYGKPVFIKAFVPGYNVTMYAFDANMKFISGSNLISGADQTKTINISGSVYAIFRLQKEPLANITPSDATTAQIGVSVNRFNGNAGTTYFTAMVAPNTGEPRSGNIVLKSLAGSTTYNIAVTQAGVSGSISVDTPTFNVDYLTHPVTVNVTSVGDWSVADRDPWITPTVWDSPSGTTAVTLKIADNTSNNAARTGTIKFYDHIAQQYATVTINQDGTPTSIGLSPFRISGSKAGYEVRSVTYQSVDSWTLVDAPIWVSVSPTSGASGSDLIKVTFNTSNPGAARTGQLRIKNTVTNEIAICLITQEG